MFPLPSRSLRVAVVQLQNIDDLNANVESVKKVLEDLRSSDTDLVTLPENSLYLRIDKSAEPEHAMTLSESFWDWFSQYAKSTGKHLLFGSVPLKASKRRRNSTVHVGPDGAIRSVYDKIHLFDVDVVGAPASRESDFFEHGSQTQILDIHGWKIGLSICYDLRFCELYHLYGAQGVHALFVPAAFLVPTGQAHWHVLLRARAIENQAFVLAPAQSGGHVSPKSGLKRETYGHSLVVGPWGEVLAECNEGGPGILRVELDPSRLREVRRQIPMAAHRRLLDIHKHLASNGEQK